MATNLPDLEFAERDAAVIEASVITAYEAIAERSLAPGDPVRLFLQAIAAIIAQQRSVIDFSAKMNVLSYSQDEYLDALGELVLGEGGRLEAQPALTTLRWVLSEARPTTYVIQQGTEVSGGGRIFVTAEQLNIPAGETVGEVSAMAQVAGTDGNGILPGQIRTVVNPLPFAPTVTNITETTGGANIEDDDNFRERIRLAPTAFSVAGPVGAYQFWTRSANQSIIDVAVEGNIDEPGRVYVRPLLEDGELPDSDVIEQVEDVLSRDDIRPLTDEVIVLSPDGVDYNIDVEYWIRTQDTGQAQTIQNRVEEAVAEYRRWQRRAIGRDINPDELVSRIIAAGAKRCVVNSPVFQVLDRTEVAQDVDTFVNYQGLEDA